MSCITALRTIRISERPNLIWVELEPKPKLVRRSCRSAMGLSKPSWPMRLRAGRLRPSARLVSVSPWRAAVPRKKRPRRTGGAFGPERQRKDRVGQRVSTPKHDRALDAPRQRSNQDALDLIQADLVVAAVIELSGAG